MVFTVGLTAATARPLVTAALPVVLVLELPAAQTATMSAFSAAASIACCETSVSDGLLPYDMLAATMLYFTLSAAACCQPAASMPSVLVHEPLTLQIE